MSTSAKVNEVFVVQRWLGDMIRSVVFGGAPPIGNGNTYPFNGGANGGHLQVDPNNIGTNVVGGWNPGDLTVATSKTNRYVDLSQLQTTLDKDDGLRFALFDRVRGFRLSDTVPWGGIQRYGTCPYTPKIPEVWSFSIANNPGGVVSTPVGTTHTVKITMKDNWEWQKENIFASVNVGPLPANGVVNNAVPATNLQIRLAHRDMLNNILQADLDNGSGQLYFNHDLSFTLSAGTNFNSVIIVGNYRKVHDQDLYDAYSPIFFDVTLIEGFSNRYQGAPGTGQIPTLVDWATVFANANSYAFRLTQRTEGNGNPDQVRWSEAENVGYMGHFNNVQWNQPRKSYVLDDNMIYDCCILEYKNQVLQHSGAIGDADLHKRIIFWVAKFQRNTVPTNINNAWYGSGTLYPNAMNVIQAGPGTVAFISGRIFDARFLYNLNLAGLPDSGTVAWNVDLNASTVATAAQGRFSTVNSVLNQLASPPAAQAGANTDLTPLIFPSIDFYTNQAIGNNGNPPTFNPFVATGNINALCGATPSFVGPLADTNIPPGIVSSNLGQPVWSTAFNSTGNSFLGNLILAGSNGSII